MISWVLINLAIILWSGHTNAYGPISNPQTPHAQYGPPNYYDPNTSNQKYQPIYFPEEDRTSYSRQRNPSYPSTPTFPQDSRYDPQYADLLSNSVLTLAHKIGMKIESHGASKSQIFSPISIASVLYLLMLGSKGQTHQELLRLFNLDQHFLYNSKNYKLHEEFGLMVSDLLESTIHPTRSRQQPAWKYTQSNDYLSFRPPAQGRELTPEDHVIEFANGIFIQEGFSLRPDYKTVVSQIYRSEITPLDFQRNGYGAASYINRWVDQKTHGKIPTIISDEINADTNVIVASALYFKALWEKEFYAGLTTTSEFFPDGLNGRSIPVQMMVNGGGSFPYYDAREYDCKIIGLPYKRNLSTMYIIMPEDSSRTKLRDLQITLTPEKIESMISKMTRRTALIALPKLHIKNSINMKHTLAELGVRTIFTKGYSDLSLISDGVARYPQASNYQQTANDSPLIFTRIGEDDDKSANSTRRRKRGITYKVESTNPRSIEPLRLKDFVLNKRITKLNPGKKRTRRQVPDPTASIKNLDALRQAGGLSDPQLFVEDVIHKVDLIVDERGTEGGAATVAYLRRSGPEVLFRADTPFMILLRHDPTKIPLFYGTVYEPE